MENKADFTQGSIPKKLMGFMLPILGALVLQSMYSAVDLMIVGQFGTTEGISGVSTGTGILQLFTFVMVQGLIQSFLIRLPVSYLLSIRENASLAGLGLAASSATVIGIVICVGYYLYLEKYCYFSSSCI
ncbi:MAG: hypothetical protein IJ747_03375 [Lachnospiraceae bacterium]|nr:hypothetical protein [Lachnospiraceae bacterium]